MFRYLIVTVSLTAAISMTTAVAQTESQGEASLIEGDGILSLLQGGSQSLMSPAANPSVSVLQQGTENSLMADQSAALGGPLLQVRQIGGENRADILQEGLSNAAELVQEGNNNEADLAQFGQGNLLIQRQEGSDLGISVTQYGGAQMIIIQRNN